MVRLQHMPGHTWRDSYGPSAQRQAPHALRGRHQWYRTYDQRNIMDRVKRRRGKDNWTPNPRCATVHTQMIG